VRISWSSGNIGVERCSLRFCSGEASVVTTGRSEKARLLFMLSEGKRGLLPAGVYGLPVLLVKLEMEEEDVRGEIFTGIVGENSGEVIGGVSESGAAPRASKESRFLLKGIVRLLLRPIAFGRLDNDAPRW
jgi:hypothetical protein